MNERDWELLRVLYEVKSITRAADRLFITQPALSIRLKNIESYFNTTLVIRNKKGIQFTSEGEFLAKKASFMQYPYQRCDRQFLQPTKANHMLRDQSSLRQHQIVAYTLPHL